MGVANVTIAVGRRRILAGSSPGSRCSPIGNRSPLAYSCLPWWSCRPS